MTLQRVLEQKLGLTDVSYKHNLSKEQLFHEAIANDRGRLRIDGPDDEVLRFDNMQTRPIVGSADWATYEVVLDIPSESERIAFGVLLHGEGDLLLEDFQFDVVDSSVPETAMSGALPAKPSNLGFED